MKLFNASLPLVPSLITITGTTPYNGAYNDLWNRDGDANGRPQWARRGNPKVDKIYWDGMRWSLRYFGYDKPGYVCDEDTPLPPKEGWRTEREGGPPPTLHYEGVSGGGRQLDWSVSIENCINWTAVLDFDLGEGFRNASAGTGINALSLSSSGGGK